MIFLVVNFCHFEEKNYGKKLSQLFNFFWTKPPPHNCLEYDRVLKISYFHILNIANFGYIYLWMIATWATSQNWKKNKIKHCPNPFNFIWEPFKYVWEFHDSPLPTYTHMVNIEKRVNDDLLPLPWLKILSSLYTLSLT
jgi:hypothetical protein